MGPYHRVFPRGQVPTGASSSKSIYKKLLHGEDTCGKEPTFPPFGCDLFVGSFLFCRYGPRPPYAKEQTVPLHGGPPITRLLQVNSGRVYHSTQCYLSLELLPVENPPERSSRHTFQGFYPHKNSVWFSNWLQPS